MTETRSLGYMADVIWKSSRSACRTAIGSGLAVVANVAFWLSADFRLLCNVTEPHLY